MIEVLLEVLVGLHSLTLDILDSLISLLVFIMVLSQNDTGSFIIEKENLFSSMQSYIKYN